MISAYDQFLDDCFEYNIVGFLWDEPIFDVYLYYGVYHV